MENNPSDMQQLTQGQHFKMNGKFTITVRSCSVDMPKAKLPHEHAYNGDTDKWSICTETYEFVQEGQKALAESQNDW